MNTLFLLLNMCSNKCQLNINWWNKFKISKLFISGVSIIPIHDKRLYKHPTINVGGYNGMDIFLPTNYG